MVQVQLLPGIIEDADKLLIGNFTIEEYTEYALTVQVNFETPSFVSMSALQPDWLQVTLLSEKYFIDKEDFLSVQQRILKNVLPPQQTQAQAA